MDERTDDFLARLNSRFAVIRDRVRGVALRRHAGFYLYGRAGTSKTYSVQKALQDVEVEYHYAHGYLTAAGLFDLFKERPNGILVLDDVGSLFQDRTALQLLLAALGKQPDGQSRIVKYRRKDSEQAVKFMGGVIAISNLDLGGGPLLTALKSRVHCLKFDPPDVELAALMRALAKLGWPLNGERLISPEETAVVTEYVIAESARLRVKLDMRVLFDKALPDYYQHQQKETESHWRDLVGATLVESVGRLKHSAPVTPEQRREMEARIARQIHERGGPVEDQIETFCAETGKSKRTFWRRLQQIESSDAPDWSDDVDDDPDDDGGAKMPKTPNGT
jgi:hypothetical protein